MKSKSDQFLTLSIDEAENGINKCLETARRLVRAAKLLCDAQYFEIASFLLCAAIDETGKAYLLLDFQDEKFENRPESVRNLASSFFEHVDKLESALEAVRTLESRIESVLKLKSECNSSPEIVEAIRELTGGFTPLAVRDEAKKTFRRPNEFLYTDYQKDKFIIPKCQATLSGYQALLKCAEKAVTLAEFERFRDKVFRLRGASRETVSKIFLESLPELMEVVRKQRAPCK